MTSSGVRSVALPSLDVMGLRLDQFVGLDASVREKLRQCRCADPPVIEGVSFDGLEHLLLGADRTFGDFGDM